MVKIFSSVRFPDPYKPWTKQAPKDITGSGVVIDGKRILTNAHVVLYASQIQVQANGSGDKLSATVESIAPGIDLAVLKLDDETFFDTHPAPKLAKILPSIKDTVLAYGFPEGGTSLSITKGIVSRIEFTSYSASTTGLRIQIDAAINPGNSGGPVVVDDKVIGLAFSHLGKSEKIGYIIPCEEIALFLQDVQDGRYDGKPAMFDEVQTLENIALRAFLKPDKAVEGTVVHRPFRTDAAYPLKEWDIITKIGDAAVDNQGMIKLGGNLRVGFRYAVQQIARDGKVPLTIVRAGKSLAIELPVTAKRPQVISALEGAYPSYFVYGPMVFSEVSSEFYWGFSRNPQTPNLVSTLAFVGNPMVSRLGDAPKFEGEALVVVSSPFFPHRLTKGYSGPGLPVVKSVNQRPVRNLAHLVELLRDCRDEFVSIAFDQRVGETYVFARAEMLAATDEILTDNGVRSQGSPDTLAIWNAKPRQ